MTELSARHHQHDPPSQILRTNGLAQPPVHRARHQFLSPRLSHNSDQLRLAVDVYVALQRDHDGPIPGLDRFSYGGAYVFEGDALAECIPVRDDEALGRCPDVDFCGVIRPGSSQGDSYIWAYRHTARFCL